MFRAGLDARVSANDQQTLPMQMRALHEYAGRRGWTIATQIRELAPERSSGRPVSRCWMPRAGAR